MATALHGKLRDRLVEQLQTVLAEATVYRGWFVSTWSLRGLRDIKSFPDKGVQFDDLQRMIGEHPLETFVTDELVANFAPVPERKDDDEAPLSSFDGYKDLGRVASQLVDAFSTLPWSYWLTIRLPDGMRVALEDLTEPLELSPRHRIVSGITLLNGFPLAHRGLGDLFVGSPPTWAEDGACLQVAMSGYFRTEPTEPFLAARDDVLAFFGLCIGLGLLVGASPNAAEPESWPKHYYVHHMRDGEWVEHQAVEVDDVHQRGILQLDLEKAARESTANLRAKLARIGLAFRTEEGRSTALAAKWLLDSYCGKDDLLRFVQVSVASEILLGDEDADSDVGLTTLMANRFAYSIATTPKARNELIRRFKSAYKVRSKIVHRGKSRLSTEERGLFHTLQMACRLLIDAELRLIAKADELGQTHNRE